MIKLVLPPDKDGYSVKDGNEVLSVKLDGGASRFRKDIIGAASTVNVTWKVDPNGYNYLRAFYRTATENGSVPFLIDLIIDDPDLTEHEAHFIPDSWQLSQHYGNTFIVNAQLEVKPDYQDSDFDVAFVALIGEYGTTDILGLTLAELAELVNESLPGALN